MILNLWYLLIIIIINAEETVSSPIYRAFCDALAQESSRHELPQQNLINNAIINNYQLFGNSNNIHDQNDNNQSIQISRFGNTRSTSQFNHILSPPPQQTIHTPSFNFITQQPNQNYQGLISLSQLNNNNNNNLFLVYSNNELVSNNFFTKNSIMCDHNISQTSPISPHMSATELLQIQTTTLMLLIHY